jgi:phage protein
MNKQELIERIEGLKNIFWNECEYVKIDFILELVSELDEPEAGHADEAPRYVKNILARLRELPLHDREVWLKTIMGEFERDFSHAKWREGYEQGKLEGAMIPCDEPQKVTVPQYVADYIKDAKYYEWDLDDVFDHIVEESKGSEISEWFYTLGNVDVFARAWLDGYEVEKEKRYLVKIIGITDYNSYLNYRKAEKVWTIESKMEIDAIRTNHTRKELEEAGFGWVFDCEGIEIEEVE